MTWPWESTALSSVPAYKAAYRRPRKTRGAKSAGVNAGLSGQDMIVIEKPPPWSVLTRTIPEFFDLNSDERDLLYEAAERVPLSALALSAQSLAELRLISVSADDPFAFLLSLTLEYLFDFGIDGKAVEEIIGAFKSLTQRHLGRDPISKPPSELPIISTLETETIGCFRIDSFGLPTRISKLLGSRSLHLWEDVSVMTERDIFEPSSSFTDLEIIYALWRAKPYAPVVCRQLSGPEDHDSFTDMVQRFVAKSAHNEKEYNILFARLRLDGGDKRTLGEVGQLYRLSRERIRQIEAKVLKSLYHRKNLATIARFRLAVVETLRVSGGACLLSELAKSVTLKMQWTEPPEEVAFASFVTTFGHFKVDQETGIIYDVKHVCLNCASLLIAIDDAVAKAKRELLISDLILLLHSYCGQEKECAHSGAIAFSKGFVSYVATKTETVIVEAERVYPGETWKTSSGTRLRLVEGILLSAEQPLHFTEVHKRARVMLPDDPKVTERNVYSWLERSDNVLLWDRGTFVHCVCVDAPSALIVEIESWLAEKLKNGLPFVNVGGVYGVFEGRCSEYHVTSEIALYMSLRRWGGGQLLYPRYPQIYSASDFESPIPAVVAVEQYVRDAGAPVPYKAIQRYAIQDLGLKEFQFQQCLSKLSNVVRTRGGGFQLTTSLAIDWDKFDLLVEYTREIARRANQVSVVKIFEDKRVSCALLGIDGPEMLYSLLRLESSGEYDLPNYPTISTRLGVLKGENRGVLTQIVDYLRNKASPCSYDELLSHFVDGLGYNDRNVYAVARSSGVLSYGRGTLVHVGAIDWTEEKESALELQALDAVSIAREAGRLCGLSSDLLERHALPQLANGIAWTRTLLATLLERSRLFRLIGNARNAFVEIANAGDIDTVEDFIRAILISDYGGASDLQTIESHLRDAGVVQKRITPDMLGEKKKVIINDQLIMLAELSGHA
jgi:hypothetical protein